MKRRPITAAFALATSLACTALAPATAQAGRGVATERFTVYADVVDVRPVYREVRYSEPRRECWTERESYVVEEHRHGPRHGRRHGGGDALVGGVIGGVIGNQLGRGGSDGARAGATIAGAIIGSAVANEASASAARHRRHHSHRPRTVVRETRPVERCRTVDDVRYEERLQHYDVTYRYEGRTFTTRLPRDPGPRLELQVSVRPARR